MLRRPTTVYVSPSFCTRRALNALLLTLALLVGTAAAAQSSSPTRDSLRRAVQQFYDWYVPEASHASAPAWFRALAHHAPGQLRLSAELERGLRRDSVAWARATGEVSGLDYDPLLNAQDACDHYTVQRVRPIRGRFLVDVMGRGGCAPHTTPDVRLEVAERHGSFIIENVFDPAQPGSDLQTALRRLHPGPR